MEQNITLKRHPLTHEYLAFIGNTGINVRVFRKPNERNWQVGQAYTSDYHGFALQAGNTFTVKLQSPKFVRVEQALEWIKQQFGAWRSGH